MVLTQTGYTFSLISTTTGAFSSFESAFGLQAPSINEGGTVAWSGFLDNGTAGIYKGSSSSATTPVATTNGGFTAFGSPTINASGRTAFYAEQGAAAGIYLSSPNAAALTAIASTTNNTFGFTSFLPDPAINNRGQVAFLAGLNTGSGVFVGDGRSLQKRVDTSGRFFDVLGTPFEGDVAPAINERGAVVFWGSLDQLLPAGSPEYSQINPAFNNGNVRGIFLVSPDGTITTIVDNIGKYLSFSGSPDINNRGEVAYIFRGDEANPNASGFPPDARYRGINVYDRGITTTVVDNTGGFARFGFVDISDRGSIAFSAITDSGALGIYTGSDPIANKVIETGDTTLLPGRTVTDLVFFSKSLNNAGQITFTAEFDDGTQGIFLATPI
jgi:hypothetical protein